MPVIDAVLAYINPFKPSFAVNPVRQDYRKAHGLTHVNRTMSSGNVGTSGVAVYQLIYQSACRTGLTVDDLREIARESAEANRERGITGVLLVQGETILQVIEGEEPAVRALYHAISRDTRHGGCTVLLTRDSDERAFPDWQMGLCEVDENEADLFRLTLSALKARRGRKEKLQRLSA